MMADLLPVVELCLFGAVSLLIGIVWQQRRALQALQADRLAVERAKRGGGNRVCAQAVVEHTAPTSLPSDTESVPEAIPNEVAARTEVTERTEVTARHAA